MNKKQKLIEKAKLMYEKSEGVKEHLNQIVNDKTFESNVDKLRQVNGIGESTAIQVAKQMSEQKMEISDLIDMNDMTEIKGIGEATAKDVKDFFEDKTEKQTKSDDNSSSNQSGDETDPDIAPTTRKLNQIKKERSGAAQKYIGKSRH